MSGMWKRYKEKSIEKKKLEKKEVVRMKDYIVRATAAGGQVRAFAAVTKDTVEEARKRHETSPVATAALGRLLTAGALMGSMMEKMKPIC